jgi:hypothetical protein
VLKYHFKTKQSSVGITAVYDGIVLIRPRKKSKVIELLSIKKHFIVKCSSFSFSTFLSRVSFGSSHSAFSTVSECRYALVM